MPRSAFALLVCMVLSLPGAAAPGAQDQMLLNDVHSRLNPTKVREVAFPSSAKEVIDLVLRAGREGVPISISGGRHAMGGQQFGTDTLHLSMSRMDDVIAFDRQNGIITVEAGIRWPALIDYLVTAQEGDPRPWGIVQKQTGADQLSIGGALSANVHGRGLTLRPIVQDVVAFRLVTAEGEELEVNRSRNPELFRLAIGGYGLFGVITSVDLKLAPRVKLRRDVEIIPLSRFAESVTRRIADGYLYGDLQFKTDERAEDFLQLGVFSAYRPVADDTPIRKGQRSLTSTMWHRLLALAHSNKAQAFTAYADYYLGTDGQIYWSDTHQLGYYDRDYEAYLGATLPDYQPGSLMISEVYVPMDRLVDFMQAVAGDAHEHQTDIIYGTIRLIREDEETFLPWARRDYACIVMNLRVTHTQAGLRRAREAFQRLIDRALERDGSYFLTYHRWARKDQLLEAYPQFPEFLSLKLKYDPEERFQSDWYRHYRNLLAPELRQVEQAD